MSTDVERQHLADVLQDNVMGIMHGDSPVEDKLMRLVGLVPMALEVVDEARDTISRLRGQVEQLQTALSRALSADDGGDPDMRGN